MTCEYCESAIASGQTRCENCGAPISAEPAVTIDFRLCPTCHRKLLALGSPACNYCGTRLPEEYIKAREGDLKRVTEVEGNKSATEARTKIDGFFSESNRRYRGGSSSLALFDITSLFDLFS